MAESSPMGEEASTLTSRARQSGWIAAEPGLASSVSVWETELGPARDRLSALATAMARPGRVPADRAIRHVTAAGISRLIRIGTNLPADLLDLQPLREPQAWARKTGIEAFVDQLALGGAATAELARLIVNAGRLFPSELVDELRSRSIAPPPLDRATVEAIAQRSLGGVLVSRPEPIAALPISQLHEAVTRDGRQVALRVRRPGVTRQLLADTRLSASLAGPLQQVLPQVGGLHPLGVIQLTTRLGLEALDLRFESLNAIELGLLAEELDASGIVVARPVSGQTSERAALTELVQGASLEAVPTVEGAAGLSALTRLTLESALVRGVFWADPAPEHLRVLDDGRLAIIGCGTVGRLEPTLRHAGILFLKSVLSGDAEGAVEAMQRAGAVPTDTDTDRLVAEFADAESLQVSRMLAGGEHGLLAGLNDAVRLLLRHDVRPPLDVVLLLRTVFAVGNLSDVLVPEGGGLMPALFPLIGRLPELIAEAEAELEED